MCGTASMILGLSILVEFRQDVATLLLRFTIAMEDGNVRVWNMSERHKGYFHGSNGRDYRQRWEWEGVGINVEGMTHISIGKKSQGFFCCCRLAFGCCAIPS